MREKLKEDTGKEHKQKEEREKKNLLLKGKQKGKIEGRKNQRI